jgi:hypothetical protein
MCFEILMFGSALLQGVQDQQASDKAAQAAQKVGEFNAGLIERDIGLLEKQRKIINANIVISEKLKRKEFKGVQGEVIAGFGYAGIDIAQGTPVQVLRENARQFEYELAVDKFNNAIVNQQISDAQEEARLNAELSRMEAGATAASLRAQGTRSLIGSIGQAAQIGYQSGMFAPRIG